MPKTARERAGDDRPCETSFAQQVIETGAPPRGSTGIPRRSEHTIYTPEAMPGLRDFGSVNGRNGCQENLCPVCTSPAYSPSAFARMIPSQGREEAERTCRSHSGE
jgi:hypothetical protein